MNEKKRNKFKINKFINHNKFIDSCMDETIMTHEDFSAKFNEDFMYELAMMKKKQSQVNVNNVEEPNITDVKIYEKNNIIPNVSENSSKNQSDKPHNNKEKCSDKPKKDDMLDDDNKMDIDDDLYNMFLKKIYRKLAVELHPDKNKTKQNKLFYKIEEYYNNNNLLDLLTIANDLNIDILEELNKCVKNKENINDEYQDLLAILFEHFDNIIKKKNEKINDYKKTIAWIWGEADDDFKKMKVKAFLWSIWKFTPQDLQEIDKMKKNSSTK